MSSILTTVKKALGIDAGFTAYDVDVIMHINTVLANLHQIGVGPDEGFQIEDDTTTWESFLGDDPRLNNVKTYVYTKVRIVFDPPATSFGIEALQNIIREQETRIYLAREAAQWEDRSATTVQVTG